MRWTARPTASWVRQLAAALLARLSRLPSAAVPAPRVVAGCGGPALKKCFRLIAATRAEHLHVKPGKGAAFVRTKLKNQVSGNTVEKTFRAGEKVGSGTAWLESGVTSPRVARWTRQT